MMNQLVYVLLEFSKDLDIVNRRILLTKLTALGEYL